MTRLDDQDLEAIRSLMDVSINEAVERKGLVTKDDISHLPTKDEFYGKMDEVMGELKAVREEISVLGHQVSDHGDRLDRIEKHLGISSD